jgi:hypothetical protein
MVEFSSLRDVTSHDSISFYEVASEAKTFSSRRQMGIRFVNRRKTQRDGTGKALGQLGIFETTF